MFDDSKKTATAGQGSTPTQQQTPPANNAVALKKFQEETVSQVQSQIQMLQEAGELKLPKDYAVGNQLKLAWLNLLEVTDRNGKSAIEVCTKESIANAFLKMVVQGLSVYKKQCDFIVYGNQLQCNPEYHGTVALARRYGGVVGVPTGNIIYEGDNFVYEIDQATGRKKIVKHEQDFMSIDNNKIKGAYATLQLSDGSTYVEIMNMNQIRQAWMQGPMKGQSPAHKNFPDQMAIKTVIGRACKLFISTSDDGGLFDDTETVEVVTPISADKVDSSKKKIDATNTENVTVIDITPTATEKEEETEEKPQSDGPGF